VRKLAARIAQCGCMMEWIEVGTVLVKPCGDDTCDAMMDPMPGRGRKPQLLLLPEDTR
jgi:hypothetical protein